MRLCTISLVRTQTVDHLKQERSSASATDKSGVTPPIEISDPNCQHVVIENCNRPGVAKSVRRSGFPKYRRITNRIRTRHSWPRNLSQHFEREKCRFGT